MAGAQHAWVGGNAAIFGTTDGGSAWTRLYTGTETITALDFLDAQRGWAVGSDALLGTTDGGTTWERLGEPAAGTLASVDFVTAAIGYGLTSRDPGTALKSTDGGRTWTVLNVPDNVRSLCFVSAQSGFALSIEVNAPPAAEVLATSDGGATWRQVLVPEGIYPPQGGKLGCSADGGVWALLLSTQLMFQVAYGLYRSADGGARWTVVAGGNTAGGQLWAKTVPAGLQSPVPGAQAKLSVLSARTAVLLGKCLACNGDDTVSVARTRDGGRTWHAAEVPGLPATYAGTAMAFADADNGFLVATPSQGHSEVLATSDGGATWRQAFDRQDLAPTDAISFVAAQIGYGLGSSADPAAILRSSDGGATWNKVGDVPGGNKGQVYGHDVLAFTDAKHGWAVTAGHALVRTADGGRTWALAGVANGPSAVVGVAFVDARHGCILGAGRTGALWSTSDGGATWTSVPGARAQAIRSAAGQSGRDALLCASATANPEWIASGAPVGRPWLSGALDGQSRWLWVNGGQTGLVGLLVTHNAGRSWTEYLLPSLVNTPGSVSFTDAQRGWMLAHGRVLRTANGGATWSQVS